MRKSYFIEFLENILTQISEQCMVCPYKLTCLEEECTLFNIESDVVSMIDELEEE